MVKDINSPVNVFKKVVIKDPMSSSIYYLDETDDGDIVFSWRESLSGDIQDSIEIPSSVVEFLVQGLREISPNKVL